jgi:hypothetical protein
MKFKEFFEEIELWLDDVRDPDDPQIQQDYGARPGMIWVKTVQEALKYLVQGNVKSIDFDNDLGVDEWGKTRKEGRHLANWIEKQAYFKKIPRLEWRVHSDNPIGSEHIKKAMQNADKFWEQE